MKRLMSAVGVVAAVGALAFAATGPATAQGAPAAGAPAASPTNGDGPIDASSDSLETIDAEHLAIYHRNVEVVQNGRRLICDLLRIYYTGKPATGAGPAKPAARGAAGSSPDPGSDWGTVDHMIADGHVYYVGVNQQTARGEHAVYEVVPDTITMTGDVVLVQGDNVARGDKLVIHVKDGHSEFFSNETGRNKPGRVRTVIYNNGQTTTTTTGQGESPPASAAPAKR